MHHNIFVQAGLFISGNSYFPSKFYNTLGHFILCSHVYVYQDCWGHHSRQNKSDNRGQKDRKFKQIRQINIHRSVHAANPFHFRFQNFCINTTKGNVFRNRKNNLVVMGMCRQLHARTNKGFRPEITQTRTKARTVQFAAR